MKYTFLHISDLHYQPEWHEEIGLVSSEFFKDIAAQKVKFENLYLAFSGDIVREGANSEYYVAFKDNFVKALDKAGFPRDRRICCPGNHDISQSALKPLLIMQEGTVSTIKNEETFNNQLPQLSKTFFFPKFENYVSCEKEFAKYTCCHSGHGGAGWDLENGVGLYCLNTALCSFGGLEDPQGKTISDKDRLHIDTRSLYRWLEETSFTTRIIMMHHPIDWLADWAKIELEQIITKNFQLILSGHAHRNSAVYSSQGAGGALNCIAPPLFSRKSENLGYAFVSVDTDSGESEVVYRQWTPKHNFVAGTSFAANDEGRIIFPAVGKDNLIEKLITPSSVIDGDTLTLLQAEFDEAITCYSSKKKTWVDRDLANMPETSLERKNAIMTKLSDLCLNFRSCIIRAPKQFGLTCLGRYIAIEHHRQTATGKAIVMVDTIAIRPHRKDVIKHINDRCKEINISPSSIAGIILDNWYGDKQACSVLREIRTEFPTVPVAILQSNDDCAGIANTLGTEDAEVFETFYLWALTRTRIRELVVAYTQDLSSLDDDIVTKKITEDIDALNIHRTPLNCLLILKLAEQAFDDSPVNRTEMIGRVLYLLFYQYDKIPRYATRPDLKDCEYALGYVCEWLIRSGKTSFTKTEFYDKVHEYCKIQILDFDCEVLFAFLVTENIFVRKGTLFGFRFSYWLYFFAAHRMHHDSNFAEYILADHRYSSMPEIIEFYTGIDRRRSDAVEHLTKDLKRMNSDFLKRTGISEDFNPFQHALWVPSAESLEDMKQLVDASVAESTLPTVVKDAIADKSYDRARPYNQELATFIDESSLIKMVQAMKGAARALRNSDHVSPESKMELLEEVLGCWTRVCQILVILSPFLAEHRRAQFEGMGFYLDKSFDEIEPLDSRWSRIMSVIAENVVYWYQEDIFSKKLGALFARNIEKNQGGFREFLILLVMTKQRPPGWEKEVESFIIRTKKNSFYLNRIHISLLSQYNISFSNEQTRQQLRRLAAMSAAKHLTGSKNPNKTLVEKAAKVIGLDSTEGKGPQIGGQFSDRKKRMEKRSRRK
jgi:hypothetical protein